MAIWSLRERPARSRPPSSGADELDQAALERAVHVLVGRAPGRRRPSRTSARSASSPASMPASSSSVSRPARCSARACARGSGQVVRGQPPVELGRPAEREHRRRRGRRRSGRPTAGPRARASAGRVTRRSSLSRRGSGQGLAGLGSCRTQVARPAAAAVRAPGDQQHGVVAGDGAEHGSPADPVDGRGEVLGGARAGCAAPRGWPRPRPRPAPPGRAGPAGPRRSRTRRRCGVRSPPSPGTA